MSDILHSSISVLDMHKKASQLNSEPLLYGKQQMNHKTPLQKNIWCQLGSTILMISQSESILLHY